MNQSETKGLFKSGGGCLWIAMGAILALLILSGLLVLSYLNQISRANEPQPIQLTLLPHDTMTPTPVFTEQGTLETSSPQRTPDPSEVVYYSIGELVQIYGTEGDGLRLRNSPGLDATINLLALENEVYEVRGGPEEADGYIWWFLINPYDNSVQGWAVGNFLKRLGR